MRSVVISDSFTVQQADVLYVGQQINLDLQALSKAYPDIVSSDRVMNLFNSYITFLYNYAVSQLGFSINDPANSSLVYHEYRYKVLYGGDIATVNPDRGRHGRGGRPVQAVWVPKTAVLTPWVSWSSYMVGLSKAEQTRIVSGTGWSVPEEGPSFRGTYKGGDWSNLGLYASGSIGVSGKEYRMG